MAFENPTTYTTGGANSGVIGTSSDTVTMTAIQSGHEAYIYKDFGVSYFGDFTVKGIFNISSAGTAGTIPFGISNTIGDDDAMNTANDGLSVLSLTVIGNITMVSQNHPSTTQSSSISGVSVGTDVYLTFDRTSTTLTLTAETGSYGGTLVGSETLTVPTTAYRYLYIGQSRGTAGTATTTYTLRDIDLTTSSGTLPFLTYYRRLRV